MHFDLVIPTYRRPRLLERLLRSIDQYDVPLALRSVIVVENGSKSGAEAVCEAEFARIAPEYVFTATAGLSNARNIGMAHGKAPILLFLDDDTRVFPNTLMAYARAFEQKGHMAFYGGPLKPDFECEPSSSVAHLLPWSVMGFSLGKENREVKDAVFSAATLQWEEHCWMTWVALIPLGPLESLPAEWAKKHDCNKRC
jgi:glycosyltransferase involved in cell wall biosynthesis